jgi:hypothetical protein
MGKDLSFLICSKQQCESKQIDIPQVSRYLDCFIDNKRMTIQELLSSIHELSKSTNPKDLDQLKCFCAALGNLWFVNSKQISEQLQITNNDNHKLYESFNYYSRFNKHFCVLNLIIYSRNV